MLSCNTMIKILKVHLLYLSIFLFYGTLCLCSSTSQKKNIILLPPQLLSERDLFRLRTTSVMNLNLNLFWDEQVHHYLYLYMEWVQLKLSVSGVGLD